jgi:hypothetical protein
MTLLTCAAGINVGILELINSHKARRPVMEKTLELISLDDEELLEVTGGCRRGGGCYQPCEPCWSPCGGGSVSIAVAAAVAIAY